MNIHAQLDFLPTPSMFEIAAFKKTGLTETLQKLCISHTASKPPNAPDIEVVEKKIAARMPSSERLYQLEEG